MLRTVVVLLAAMLGGCDATERVAAGLVANVPSPTLVFRPGFEVLVDGQPVAVVGTDRCPHLDGAMLALFGPDPLAGEQGCMVLSEDREHVVARFRGGDGRIVAEQWKIVRSEGRFGTQRTSLRRPDGSPVIPAAAARVATTNGPVEG